jgi:hypothetical protein
MLTYPSPGVPALASSSHEPNCRNVTSEADGSALPSVIGVDVLGGEALAGGADDCALDVGVVVVGELGAGAVGFGALGRPLPFPLPCASAFTASAITRPVARAAVRGIERFVTMPLGESVQGQKAKGKGQIDPSPLTPHTFAFLTFDL